MVEVFPKAADLSEFAFQDPHGRKQTDSSSDFPRMCIYTPNKCNTYIQENS